MFDKLEVGERFRLGFSETNHPMLIRLSCEECYDYSSFLMLQSGEDPALIISRVLAFFSTLNQLLEGVGSVLEFKFASVQGDDAEAVAESVKRGFEGANLPQTARFDSLDFLVVDRTATN